MSDRSIKKNLERHAALMERYESQGLPRLEASRKAFLEITPPAACVECHGAGVIERSPICEDGLTPDEWDRTIPCPTCGGDR